LMMNFGHCQNIANYYLFNKLKTEGSVESELYNNITN